MQLTPFALEHEEGLALFVEPTYRSRFRESLASPKRREKLISTLDHFPNLDYRWAVEITTKATTSTVDAYLRNAGAPKQCYVLASDGDYLQADESEGFKFILGTTGGRSRTKRSSGRWSLAEHEEGGSGESRPARRC